MPFCPACRYEYRSGVNTCPDCEVTLVSSLPPVEAEEEAVVYEDWVQLARLNSDQYAVMLVEVLRERGIPVVIVSGTGHFGATGQMGPSSFRPIGGGYSVMVPAEYVVAADREAEAVLGDDWVSARLIEIEDGEEPEPEP